MKSTVFAVTHCNVSEIRGHIENITENKFINKSISQRLISRRTGVKIPQCSTVNLHGSMNHALPKHATLTFKGDC